MTTDERLHAFKKDYEALCQKWGCSLQIQFRPPQILTEASGLPLMQTGLDFVIQAQPGWVEPEQEPKK